MNNLITSNEDFPQIKRAELKTLQVNLGYKCNQKCVHCHVNAGPDRKEMMDSYNIALIPKAIRKYNIKTLDLTGGAPELHPEFRSLIEECSSLNIEIIDRCNLTILTEKNQEDLAEFLARNEVVITASLPCYEESNVDQQRGEGVFERSITALKKLNRLGYGINKSKLLLNLVYNPQGATLPPDQELLEKEYRKILLEKYKIEFTNLYTIVNMPINRFALKLSVDKQYDQYMKLLFKSFNANNLGSVMCKELISVDWNGKLYDCDFNQQIGLGMGYTEKYLKNIVEEIFDFSGKEINVNSHCYGCTAGHGSSCGGSLK